MKIIVVGAGKVGSTLAVQLTHEGHDIILIDNNREVLQQMEFLDIMTIYGNGGSLPVQRDAEVGSADLLIAATPLDEINMICCIIARKLGCLNTIARVRKPEYAEQLDLLKQELGLSRAVNPEWATAVEIFRLVQLPAFLKREAFAKGRVEIVEVEVKEGGRLDGVVLSELRNVFKVKMLVSAIVRGENAYIPDGSFRLQSGDKIYITSAASQLPDLVREAGLRQVKTRSCMIVGGSRIAQYLSQMLLRAGVKVTLIEKKRQRANELAEILPNAEIICADGASKAVLDATGIDSIDALTTLTGVDEENLIISMYAKHVNVPQVVTKINRTEFTNLFEDAGVTESIVSPKLICADEIIQYVRAMQNTTGGSMLSLHTLAEGKVEAIEFEVDPSTWHLGESMAQIKLKHDILIACIYRAGRVIIPGGGDTFECGDTVVVVTPANRGLGDLNDIFSEA